MKIVWIVAAGVLAGAALARRRHHKVPEVDRWSAATDPVTPSSNA